jgi:hypothetical protein
MADFAAPFPMIGAAGESRPPLITNGGRHSARAWAEHVAEHFLTPGAARIADRDSVVELTAVTLEPVFLAGLEDVRLSLAVMGADGLDEPDDRAALAETGVAAMVLAAAGSAAEAYWRRREIQAAATRELAHHLRTADLVERLWWCDEHPFNNAAAAFRARHHPGV